MATKKQKIRNVPNLRFPGFEEGWERKKLGDFIDVITGIPLRSEDILEDKSGIPILRGINITEGFIRHSKEIDRYYPKEKTSKINKYLLEEGDLVIGMDGSKVGKNAALISKFDIGSILIQRVARVRALGNASTNYIFQKVFSKEFQNYVDVVNTSSGIPHISLQQIKDFETGFPQNLAEQKKIAAFLTLIDERITTQNKIIEQLESLIKGIRDKLFTKEIRFPEFKGKWNKYKVSDLLEFFPTNSLSWEHLEYNAGSLYNLHYGLIHQGAPTQIDMNDYTLPCIKTESSPNKFTLCEDGDVVFADASEDTLDVAKAVEFVNCENKRIVCGLHTIHGRDKLNLTVKGFKGYVFASAFFRSQIRQLAQGTKVFSVSVKTFSECFIEIPSKGEQVKISGLLSVINQKIDLQKNLLHGYEKQKSYLLHSLFI